MWRGQGCGSMYMKYESQPRLTMPLCTYASCHLLSLCPIISAITIIEAHSCAMISRDHKVNKNCFLCLEGSRKQCLALPFTRPKISNISKRCSHCNCINRPQKFRLRCLQKCATLFLLTYYLNSKFFNIVT